MRWAAAIATLSLTLGAQGQNERVESLLRAIAEGGFIDRELATRELEAGAGVTLVDLESVLRRSDLSLEQRRRLSHAAERRFMLEPRAAMGISLGPVLDLGLQITGTTPGFDAAEKLRAEDIIASIGDLEIREQLDLQVAIISREPGSVVPVRVVRGGELLELELRLGSWSDLGPNAPLNPDTLARCWAYRSRSYAGAAQPPAIPSLGLPPGFGLDRALDGLPPGEPAELVVGGRPRHPPGRAAGLDMNRRLSSSPEDREQDYLELLTARLAELNASADSLRARIAQQAQFRDASRQRGDERHSQEYQRQIDEHERMLESVLSEIQRVNSERRRLSEP
jgi:hypothetical protein